MQKIVVAIDDSGNARAALRWALDHSGPDDDLVAVHAWHLPFAGGYETAMLDPAAFEEGAAASLAAVVDDVATAEETGRIRQLVVAGHTPSVILEQGESSDMIVIGARGHGGFAGLLLGSVTTTVVNHTKRPTVLVPMPEE
jgi:nucleotide-binding universal stress UspA family protein